MNPATLPMRRKGRTAGGLVAAVVLAAAALGIGYAVTDRPRADAGTAPVVRTTSAPVVRGTVTERVQVAGTLGYDGEYHVVHQGTPGVVTAVPDPGGTVPRGGILYAVSNEPVRLLYGTLPAYRGFESGMPDGPDVAELEANLVALGFDPDHAITVDNHFSAATAAAIRRWQAACGLPASRRTGALPAGGVVFLPDAVRISQVEAPAGGAVGPNAAVLTVSGTARVVSVQLTPDKQSLVHLHDQVQVTLPGAAPFPGTVIRVGRVATAPPAPGGGGGGGQPSGPATVPVTIGVQLPPGGPDLDQAPVQVAIATAQHADVLLVPVTALLARPGGGYQVRLAGGGFVQVRPGLFDEGTGQVEVTGVQPGQQVEVPAP
jgi:peptidoglycan hydrolase-like protein with peptidoglycan-binding domain